MNEEEHNRIVQQLNETHASEVARLQFDIDRLRQEQAPLLAQVDQLRAELEQAVVLKQLVGNAMRALEEVASAVSNA